MQEFKQIDWNNDVEQDCRALIRLAIEEDVEGQQDWTTVALVPADCLGAAELVAREAGVVAGMKAIEVLFEEMDAKLTIDSKVVDSDQILPGTSLATFSGNIRDLLTCERPLLNLLARLMGIATMARRFVNEVKGTGARVYDTRKTTPGWRRLEKYAVRCGGASNHRTGLFDAVLIKDNHLAQSGEYSTNIAGAVRDARLFLNEYRGPDDISHLPIEIEVESLEQLEEVLPAGPDIVLLDNMSAATLREAVAKRDAVAPEVELEASGGIKFDSLREIAETGINRISVGALTHSVRSLDIGLDWKSRS